MSIISLSRGPMSSAVCLLQGFRLLLSPGLRPYLWGPLLVNLLLYSVGGWLAIHYFSAAMDWFIPTWLDWLRWLLWPLFALILSAIAFFSFTLVANLIGSPFYGLLAERVLGSIEGGEESSGSMGANLLKELAGSLASEGRRLWYFALRGIPILLLFLIPVLNLAAPFLWLLFGAWSLSLEYLSYPLEVKGLRFEEQRRLAKEHRLEALSFGAWVMVGLAVPVLNVLIPPAAVIGAAIFVSKRSMRQITPGP